MKKILHVAIAVALAASAHVLVAQSGNDLFQKALSKERAEGQLDEAIQIYERIVKEFATDRALAAKALVQLGRCYDKLGKAEAKTAYERVIREYADQRVPADEARARLAELSRAPGPIGAAARVVWAGDDVNSLGAPSPDGRYLTYVERKTGQLAVRDLLTGKDMRLTEGDGVPGLEFALSSIIAADGRQVAFAWLTKDQLVELRVAQIGRPHSRAIYRNPEVNYVVPLGWSKDGRHIFAVLNRQDGAAQIADVSVADGTARVLKTLDWQTPSGSVSPDGRYIAYDSRPAEGALKHDLFLLATDGSREVPLVQHSADDKFPLWAPDGSGVVFVSDRSGSDDVWFVPVASSQPAGPATRVKQGRSRPMGFTRDGALYYAVGTSSVDVYLGTIDPQSGRAMAGAAPISERFVGSNIAPDWSPDGSRLSYVSERGSGGAGSRTIVVRSIVDGSEHELVPRLQYFHRPRWAMDNRTIVAQGSGLRGPTGLFSIDAETGRLDTLVKSEPGSAAAHQVWSPDGKTLFYSEVLSKNPRIVARDLATGGVHEIHRASGGEKAVSPNGKWIAVQIQEPNQPTAIRLIATAGGGTRDLFSLPALETVSYFGGLSWTPDGKRLLFVKAREGTERRELWQVDVESGRAEATGLAAPGLQYVRLHPNGRQLAYSAGKRQEEIWVIEHFLPATQTRTTSAARR